jgi:hypothetical protein
VDVGDVIAVKLVLWLLQSRRKLGLQLIWTLSCLTLESHLQLHELSKKGFLAWTGKTLGSFSMYQIKVQIVLPAILLQEFSFEVQMKKQFALFSPLRKI